MALTKSNYKLSDSKKNIDLTKNKCPKIILYTNTDKGEILAVEENSKAKYFIVENYSKDNKQNDFTEFQKYIALNNRKFTRKINFQTIQNKFSLRGKSNKTKYRTLKKRYYNLKKSKLTPISTLKKTKENTTILENDNLIENRSIDHECFGEHGCNSNHFSFNKEHAIENENNMDNIMLSSHEINNFKPNNKECILLDNQLSNSGTKTNLNISTRIDEYISDHKMSDCVKAINSDKITKMHEHQNFTNYRQFIDPILSNNIETILPFMSTNLSDISNSSNNKSFLNNINSSKNSSKNKFSDIFTKIFHSKIDNKFNDSINNSEKKTEYILTNNFNHKNSDDKRFNNANKISEFPHQDSSNRMNLISKEINIEYKSETIDIKSNHLLHLFYRNNLTHFFQFDKNLIDNKEHSIMTLSTFSEMKKTLNILTTQIDYYSKLFNIN